MAEPSAADRSEAPSPRRIERARRAGAIPLSVDLTAGFMFACAMVALVVAGREWVGGLTSYLRSALAGAGGAASWSKSIAEGLRAAGEALGLPLGVVVASGLLVGLAQTRGNLATDRWRGDARRRPPTLSRIFGRESTVDAAVALGKLVLLCGVAYASLRPCVIVLGAVLGAGAMAILTSLTVVLRRIVLHLALAMVVLGFADYLWQVWRYRSRLRMTRDEARREYKEDEGDPEYKAERQRRHRDLQLGNGLAESSGASVLLVDPGVAVLVIAHASVAGEPAMLVARVGWARAQQLESAAHGAGIPRLVEPALVRAFAGVTEGEPVPRVLDSMLARAVGRAGRRARLLGGKPAAAPVEVAGAPAGERAP